MSYKLIKRPFFLLFHANMQFNLLIFVFAAPSENVSHLIKLFAFIVCETFFVEFILSFGNTVLEKETLSTEDILLCKSLSSLMIFCCICEASANLSEFALIIFGL